MLEKTSNPAHLDSSRRTPEAASYIENNLAAARNFNELYAILGDLVKVEQENNQNAVSIGRINTFLARERAKIGALIDGILGQTELYNDPKGIDEVLSTFPVTALGEISEEYGLRTRAEALLNKLKVEQQGVDVVL